MAGSSTIGLHAIEPHSYMHRIYEADTNQLQIRNCTTQRPFLTIHKRIFNTAHIHKLCISITQPESRFHCSWFYRDHTTLTYFMKMLTAVNVAKWRNPGNRCYAHLILHYESHSGVQMTGKRHPGESLVNLLSAVILYHQLPFRFSTTIKHRDYIFIPQTWHRSVC